jgi:hypothetical protein
MPQTDAKRFLATLDPGADRFTFQRVDDNEKRRDRGLAQILHGPLARLAGELRYLKALLRGAAGS